MFLVIELYAFYGLYKKVKAIRIKFRRFHQMSVNKLNDYKRRVIVKKNVHYFYNTGSRGLEKSGIKHQNIKYLWLIKMLFVSHNRQRDRVVDVGY